MTCIFRIAPNNRVQSNFDLSTFKKAIFVYTSKHNHQQHFNPHGI